MGKLIFGIIWLVLLFVLTAMSPIIWPVTLLIFLPSGISALLGVAL